MTILKIKNGRFSFGGVLIFKNVNLQVSKGETLCLLGPNGCGKTTLIDSLLGINKLDSGEITLANRTLSRLSPRQVAQTMAYVPQKHARHFSFSVLDVLLMGRAPYTSFFSSPGPSDRRRAEDLLASLNLSGLKHRDYTRLSGGETQLVMIMRALMQDTQLIVMDEPSAHLDFRNELIVLEAIVRLVKERRVALIMATHFPNHAFYFENQDIPVQVAFMDHQEVHPSGPPSAALTEENLERFYGVKTSVLSHAIPGKGRVNQIIPLQTMD